MDKAWQDWVQWIGSIILIPLVAIVGFNVFENKSDIAVLKAKVDADHYILIKLDDKMDVQGSLLVKAVTKLEALEKTDDG